MGEGEEAQRSGLKVVRSEARSGLDVVGGSKNVVQSVFKASLGGTARRKRWLRRRMW